MKPRHITEQISYKKIEDTITSTVKFKEYIADTIFTKPRNEILFLLPKLPIGNIANINITPSLRSLYAAYELVLHYVNNHNCSLLKSYQLIYENIFSEKNISLIKSACTISDKHEKIEKEDYYSIMHFLTRLQKIHPRIQEIAHSHSSENINKMRSTNHIISSKDNCLKMIIKQSGIIFHFQRVINDTFKTKIKKYPELESAWRASLKHSDKSFLLKLDQYSAQDAPKNRPFYAMTRQFFRLDPYNLKAMIRFTNQHAATLGKQAMQQLNEKMLLNLFKFCKTTIYLGRPITIKYNSLANNHRNFYGTTHLSKKSIFNKEDQNSHEVPINPVIFRRVI